MLIFMLLFFNCRISLTLKLELYVATVIFFQLREISKRSVQFIQSLSVFTIVSCTEITCQNKFRCNINYLQEFQLWGRELFRCEISAKKVFLFVFTINCNLIEVCSRHTHFFVLYMAYKKRCRIFIIMDIAIFLSISLLLVFFI